MRIPLSESKRNVLLLNEADMSSLGSWFIALLISSNSNHIWSRTLTISQIRVEVVHPLDDFLASLFSFARQQSKNTTEIIM